MLDLLLLGSYRTENSYLIPDIRGTDHITISVWEDCVKHAKSLKDCLKSFREMIYINNTAESSSDSSSYECSDDDKTSDYMYRLIYLGFIL
jgi:hypothetical protein